MQQNEYFNNFNPASNFHLSFGINYPNKSDKILGKKEDPGSDIFIHGSCVTIGCIPITNESIEELNIIAVDTKSRGQAKIPVHIFPCRMNEENMQELMTLSDEKPELWDFWANIKESYDFFEKNKKLTDYRVNNKGKYIFEL